MLLCATCLVFAVYAPSIAQLSYASTPPHGRVLHMLATNTLGRNKSHLVLGNDFKQLQYHILLVAARPKASGRLLCLLIPDVSMSVCVSVRPGFSSLNPSMYRSQILYTDSVGYMH